MNEAALLAARRDRRTISMSELEEAIDRVVVGPERKTRRITGGARRSITAYHEAGSCPGWRTSWPNADPVHKTLDRGAGMSGGHTRLLPEEERFLWKRSQDDGLAGPYSLGGMAAEELVLARARPVRATTSNRPPRWPVRW